MANLLLSKDELREIAKNYSLSPKRRLEAMARAYDSLKTLEGNILSFASTKNEINLWPLNTLLLEEGRLFLPRVNEGKLEVVYGESLNHSKWGILEPTGACESPSVIDVILVPGLAFTKRGDRLGRGKGHYDRLLSTLECRSIGIGFEEQLMEEIPLEPHDICLKELLLF